MIKIQNLTAGYGKTIVLSHINLELKNETYGIIGPNGSGKTTLFRVLTNSLKLKSGHISKINGVCGYLPQKFGCMPLLTVKEQLQYFCYLKKIPVAEENEEICRKYSTPRFFPGCMVRRVGIAQAILGHPKLILFDEPTTGLDIEERCHFYEIFQQLNGICPVLIASHITEDIVEGCTNTIILKNGIVILQEKTKDIKPSLQEVYLSCMHGTSFI